MEKEIRFLETDATTRARRVMSKVVSSKVPVRGWRMGYDTVLDEVLYLFPAETDPEVLKSLRRAWEDNGFVVVVESYNENRAYDIRTPTVLFKLRLEE